MLAPTRSLLPPLERTARAAEKRRLLLRFLRDELYTTADIVALLLGLKQRQAAYVTLASMERDGLLRREQVQTPDGWRVTLFGITPHGQAFAFDHAAGEAPVDRCFEPGRVGLTVLRHTLDLQRLRLACMAAGWRDWIAGDRVAEWTAGQGRPDAIVTSPSGQRFAVECERTIKTTKRYQSILADRLQAARRGDFDKIVWVCPTAEQAARLATIIRSISYVPIAGQQVAIDRERHHQALIFTHYGEWPKE